MKKRYFILRFVIILFLVLPFLLKTVNRSLEPYPAILFPAGGKKVKGFEDNMIVYNEMEYFLLLKSGETKKIDLMNTFNRLPNPMVKALLRNNLGLVRNSKKPFKINLAGNLFVLDLNKQIPDTTIEEGKTWLRKHFGEVYNIDKEKIINLKVNNCKTYKDLNNNSLDIKKDCVLKQSISLI